MWKVDPRHFKDLMGVGWRPIAASVNTVEFQLREQIPAASREPNAHVQGNVVMGV
jgi:hypothetical protein